MAFFAKTKPADQPQERASTGKRIALKSRRFSEETIRAMAEQTLINGGFVAPPKAPEIGDKMPDGTAYAGVSPDTGNPMYATPADAPLTMTFNQAQKYAQDANAQNSYGHDDWHVPTKDELNVLFNNRAAVGGFNVNGSSPVGWYRSATPSNTWNTWCQRFSDGVQGGNDVGSDHSSVRLVR